jgi:threonine-phosphate decarboxylase
MFGMQRQPSALSHLPSSIFHQPSSAPDRDTLLWLCNPNNPTGRTLPPADILNLCGKAAITVIDQSYEDYTLVPMLSAREAAQKPHLILVHSLTKTYAIPGLRIGYITAAPELIRLLRHHVRPWSVNALAVAAAKWLVTHDTRAIPHLNVYLAETARLRQQLNALPGIHVTNTDTNFMLATIAQTTAAALKDFLAVHHHILIRNASNFKGLTPNHFRIATQRRDENQLLVSAISQFIGNFQR